ncbi:MAG: hypothetical protein R3E45_14775, partial [Rhodocyclaceae bacterium]
MRSLSYASMVCQAVFTIAGFLRTGENSRYHGELSRPTRAMTAPALPSAPHHPYEDVLAVLIGST